MVFDHHKFKKIIISKWYYISCKLHGNRSNFGTDDFTKILARKTSPTEFKFMQFLCSYEVSLKSAIIIQFNVVIIHFWFLFSAENLQ